MRITLKTLIIEAKGMTYHYITQKGQIRVFYMQFTCICNNYLDEKSCGFKGLNFKPLTFKISQCS